MNTRFFSGTGGRSCAKKPACRTPEPSGYSLVVKVLGVLRLGKEIPAFEQQPRVLRQEGHERQHLRLGDEGDSQQDDRYDEHEQDEAPARNRQHPRAFSVEELTGVERASHEPHRALAHMGMAHSDRRLDRRLALDPRIPVKRCGACNERGQREYDSPGPEEADQMDSLQRGKRRGKRETRGEAEQRVVCDSQPVVPFLQESQARIDHRLRSPAEYSLSATRSRLGLPDYRRRWRRD